jgi:hypothetical protein
MINKLYTEYFQKSKAFLYPLLGIKRGAVITPMETYVAWEDEFLCDDKKLILTYHLRDDKDFLAFEKTKLLDNNLLSDFRETNHKVGVYIFDFQDFTQDWDYFLNGKYSRMSPPVKRRILEFFKNNHSNYNYLDSYLNPDKHFKTYADLLAVPVEVLIKVGELCSLPDFKKETLKLNAEELINFNIFEQK